MACRIVVREIPQVVFLSRASRTRKLLALIPGNASYRCTPWGIANHAEGVFDLDLIDYVRKEGSSRGALAAGAEGLRL